jgi:hypothetical protein
VNQHRRTAHELLSLLSSHEAQLAYARTVAIADVPSELVCMWFDDFWSAVSDNRESTHDFSSREWQVLAEFSAVYQAELAALPMRLEDLRDSDGWRRVRSQARQALDALAPTDSPAAG